MRINDGDGPTYTPTTTVTTNDTVAAPKTSTSGIDLGFVNISPVAINRYLVYLEMLKKINEMLNDIKDLTIEETQQYFEQKIAEFDQKDQSLVAVKTYSPMAGTLGSGASKDLSAKWADTIVRSPFVVGFQEDLQRSRTRFVNRNIPPFGRNVAQFGRRQVPRRWR